MDVGSPFDHPRSGILYVARHLPPPGRDGLPAAYLDELCELITAAGGRTLGLFSSMRAAPQAAARQRAFAARGGNGFMTVAAAQAALLLAQGTGRLLRTMSDRGVVAVLDPRLVTKQYGSFLRASLPPYWATTDPEVVRGALRRLADAPAGPRCSRR